MKRFGLLAILPILLIVGCGSDFDAGDTVTLPELGIEHARVIEVKDVVDRHGHTIRYDYTVQFSTADPAPNDAEEISPGIYTMIVSEGQIDNNVDSNRKRAQEVNILLSQVREDRHHDLPQSRTASNLEDDEPTLHDVLNPNDLTDLIRAEIASMNGESVSAEDQIESFNISVYRVERTEGESSAFAIRATTEEGKQVVILTDDAELADHFSERQPFNMSVSEYRQEENLVVRAEAANE